MRTDDFSTDIFLLKRNPCFICEIVHFHQPRAKIVAILQSKPPVICIIQVFQCKYRCEFYHSLTNHGNIGKITVKFKEITVSWISGLIYSTSLLWTTANIRTMNATIDQSERSTPESNSNNSFTLTFADDTGLSLAVFNLFPLYTLPSILILLIPINQYIFFYLLHFEDSRVGDEIMTSTINLLAYLVCILFIWPRLKNKYIKTILVYSVNYHFQYIFQNIFKNVE